MSAHIELDFNDDGTITMTARPAKGEDVRKVTFPALASGVVVPIGVRGGETDEGTHTIYIGDKETMREVMLPHSMIFDKQTLTADVSTAAWGIG